MKNIVLIDDTQINLTLLWHWVKKIPDYTPVSFTNPVEALDWCLNNAHELVIVDYMMPEMDGLAFIKALRQKHPKSEIPILMVTANDQVDIRYKALQSGANDFLTKPVDKTEFSFRVETMLTLRSSYKKLTDKSAWLADEVRKATDKILNREQEIIFRLVKAAEYRDPETGGHIKRMAHFSSHIAANLGLSPSEQTLILEAAPMHDIGKVGIPDSILLKPGKLTTEEFSAMQDHPQIGFNILSGSESDLLQTGATIALSHHEKFDGSGYPNGLKGDDIPLYGRIIAVADVFDALTSERPYKRAWSIEDAVRFLKDNSEQHFDPRCVDAFLRNWDDVVAIKQRFQD